MKFGQWLPDQDDYDNPGLLKALNVIPATYYKPINDLITYGTALPNDVLGAVALKNDAGDAFNFAGTINKLHRMTSSTWADVGTGFITPAEGRWVFERFGSNVIASNGSDPIQKFDIAADSSFTALGGTPPRAKHLAIVRDFLVLGSLNTGANKLQWSGLNDIVEWTGGTKESGSQLMPGGGEVTGLVGGEFGLVFQEDQITRMEYVGPPLTFTFDTLETGIGCVASGSIAKYGNKTYFLSENGFYYNDGTQSHPIGAERIDKTFYKDLDNTYLYKITAAIDPINKLVIWSYAGTGNTGGQPNKLIIYSWVQDKWAEVSLNHEFIYTSLSEGYTLEELDSFGTMETLPASLDSRIWQGGSLVLSVFNTSHTLAYFTGTPLPATIETGESQLMPGQRTLVTEVWPEISGTVCIKLGSRASFQVTPTYTGSVTTNTLGFAPFVDNNRYHRFQFCITDWTAAQGFKVTAEKTGKF